MLLVMALPALPAMQAPSTVHALDYAALRRDIAAERRDLIRGYGQQRGPLRGQALAALEQKLLSRMDQLFVAWIGTPWGLGMPQTSHPRRGKINCGAFVAMTLKHAGFNLPVWKFQRQAASHAIQSIAPKRAIRYFRRRPMSEFLDTVRAMGPGLFVIGLDFHIGFLRLGPRGMRFIHASYLPPHRVIDEPARSAIPIVTSKHRVVGKILQPGMLRAWISGQSIKVHGGR